MMPLVSGLLFRCLYHLFSSPFFWGKKMKKEVKELVNYLVDDAKGPTMVYQLLQIINLLKSELEFSGHYFSIEEHFNQETKDLLEACNISQDYLDVYFEIDGE